jgi:hypothetical protein
VRAEGRAEGVAVGKTEGILAGVVRTAQMLLGMKPVPKRALLSKTREELQAMFEALCTREPRLARVL